MTWIQRALTAPSNLIAGAGALALSALTWNPLPLVLFGLGQPVWVYTRKPKPPSETRESVHTLERQLGALMVQAPCGLWVRQGRLPDYASIYARLVQTRDHTARVVAARRDAASALANDIVARMDEMLQAYLIMVRERLRFHCALAGVFPQLPEPEPEPTLLARIGRALVVRETSEPAPWCENTPFVSPDQSMTELRRKIAGFEAQIARQPAHESVYRPIIETLAKHLQELEVRGRHDLAIAAQLEVFPEQFAIILAKLGTPQADVGDIVTEMTLLLEQTDDTVTLAEELRAN
jgi:hypothetical protein